MIFLFKPYSIMFMVGILLSLALAIITWKRRPAPGALAFSLFSLAVSWWSAFWILEIGAADLSLKIIMAKLEYLGILSFLPFWLVFVCTYTGRPIKSLSHWLPLFGIPVITIAVVWTNELHGWFWSDIFFLSKPIGRVTIWEHGFWFWILAAYQYTLVAHGIWRIWSYHPVNIRSYRKQAVAMTIGALTPICINLVYLLRIPAIDGLDFTPLSLTLTALVYVLAIYRFNLLDISAVARKTLLEKVPDGILVINSDGVIMDLNPATEKLLKLRRSAMTGLQLGHIWPEIEKIRNELPLNASLELNAQESGTGCAMEISLTCIYDRKLEPAGQLIMLRDITERKLTQRKLEELYLKEKKLTADLQEEIANRSKYTRALVHELKTPLTAILSSSELLEIAVKDDFLTAVVKNIRKSSLNLEKRTDDLIDLARGEIGLLRVDAEPVDVNDLIREVYAEILPAARLKGLELNCETTDLPLVNGDRRRLKAVLLNLLNNALKYTVDGSVLIRAIDHDSETLLVQVKDTGKGIEPDRIKDIFDPYRRKSTGGQKYSGIGIGLALCRVYIELHAGRIWVESHPGSGTSFYFTLPLIHSSRLNAGRPVLRLPGESLSNEPPPK